MPPCRATPPRIRIGRASGLGLIVALTTLAMLAPAGAGAADRIYWGNGTGFDISFAALDGSGGATLRPASGSVQGLGIDLAAGKIYWAENGSNLIRVANLDGTGTAATVNTTGTTVGFPLGAAIDTSGGRFYWANAAPPKISFARLDGSGGGDLATAGATLANPEGVAVDPAAGRIYWANFTANKISFARLDGSGGGDLATTGATVNGPNAVAVDPAAGRIYWTNQNGNKISFANLDGSGGGGDLNTTGATVTGPRGLAIDADGGRVYWGNGSAPKVSFANLNGSGGGDLPTTGATISGPTYPVLLKAPPAAGAPVVGGGSGTGTTLDCTAATWGANVPGSFLFQAPQTFTYRWSRDGVEIAGATGTSITADQFGDYRCLVTAANAAGATTQTSAPHAVPSNQFTIGKPKRNRRAGTARLPVTLPGPGSLALSGKGIVAQRPFAGAPSSSSESRPVTAAGTVKLKLKAKGKARKTLKRAGKVKLRSKVTFTPTGGVARAQTKSVKLIRRR